MQSVLSYALIPCLTFIFGGITAKIRQPSNTWRSVIQHFTSGVVFAVVAVDLLPGIIKSHEPYEVAIGFSAGVFLMLLIRTYAEKMEAQQHEKAQAKMPVALLGAVAVDVLVDGFLIGVSFAANEEAGQFLTIALGLEMFSLGLALSTSLSQTPLKGALGMLVITSLAAVVVISAASSHLLIQFIPATSIPLLLAFGLAALLYLVTEELLHEAHQYPDNAFITATFFIGFLLFLILSMLH
ncbi:MAG: transporter [Methyloglobulus sp.]|nr:transporter [Methyloglobulus sp.]